MASQGERVLVTNRDRVVAELVPPEAGRSLDVADALLSELLRKGYLTPALVRSLDPPLSAPEMPLADLLQDLSSDRADR